MKGYFVMLRRSLPRSLAALTALALAAASPLMAEDAKPAGAPQTCGGIDILAEAESKDPDLFKSVTAEAKKLENTEAILWKVEKAGVAPSHLLGTIHISDPRVTTLSPKIKDAFAQSKTVVLEFIGGEAAAAPAMTGGAGAQLIYTDGTTLESKLTPDEFAKVKDVVGKTGMPGEVAGMLRPWIVNMLLAISDCERKKMETGADALDSQIEKEAKAKGLELAGLETAEQQINALTGIPEDQQIQMLKAALKYVDRSNDMLETLVQMYLKRQIGAAMPLQIAMAAKVGTPANAYDGFLKLLLSDRNTRMRDTAKPILDKGSAFIAVGAMHLPGPTGLVALLRGAGYTVTAVE